MIIKYSPKEKIKLSLKKKIISRELYQKDIDNVIRYGKKREDLKASVVIVAYNEGDDLIRNLKYWEKQSNQEFELILVDNGLDDAIVEKINEFDILYIKAKNNLGCCGGRNVGAVYANTELLVFGDADGYNPENYIEKIFGIMSDKKVIAVRGKVLPIDKRLQKEFMPHHYDLGVNCIPSIINAEGNSVWRTNDYLKVGGFEDSLAGGEGLVLQYRMVEFYGYDMDGFVYDPKLILYHDYYNDDTKLEYKIRQNIIVKKQLQDRYPFLNNITSYYAEKRGCTYLEKHSDEISTQINKITNHIHEEYETLLNKQKELRYQNSHSTKRENRCNFSIIIPCYSLGLLLSRAIESIFAQTLENIEVIVVDDASPDDETQKVLEEVSEYVHVVKLKQNGGVSVARNEGIKRAKSEYILCLDADDTIESTYLEKAKNVFDADEEVALVSCWAQFFGDNNFLWKSEDYLKIKDALINSPVHTATCFRKKKHDNGGGYDVNLRGYEDWDHWLKIMKQGGIVRIIPEALFNYYVRPGSKVNTSNKNSFELVTRIIENHKNLYEKYFVYVIAKKHEQLAKITNKNRTKNTRIIKQKTRIILGVRINSMEDILRLSIKAKKKVFPRKWK